MNNLSLRHMDTCKLSTVSLGKIYAFADQIL